MCEKASKGTFLKPEILQNHSNVGKGEKKEKKEEREEGREEKKKAMVALLVFIITTLEFLAEKAVGRKRSIWR